MKTRYLLIPLLLMSCNESEITSTWVPKEHTQMRLPSAPSMGGGSSHREVDWDIPSGWTEQPPSSMRVGSFLASTKNGQDVDISVVPLSGAAGGDLANINRWRGQINLGPLDSSQLDGQSQKMTLSGREAVIVDFTSSDLLIDNKMKKRVVAAIFKQGEQTWFFKMTGEEAAIEEVKPKFMNFLKTLHFHNHG